MGYLMFEHLGIYFFSECLLGFGCRNRYVCHVLGAATVEYPRTKNGRARSEVYELVRCHISYAGQVSSVTNKNE